MEAYIYICTVRRYQNSISVYDQVSGWDIWSDERIIIFSTWTTRHDTCLLGADAPAQKKGGIPRKPGGVQARKKERKKEKRKKKKNRKEKSLHKTLERAEGYSEIVHMGASREARGLEWGFAGRIVRE